MQDETKVNCLFVSFLYLLSPYSARLCAPCGQMFLTFKQVKNYNLLLISSFAFDMPQIYEAVPREYKLFCTPIRHKEEINRGYYMAARGYECYLQVFSWISHSSLVRCRFEHEKIKFISTSGHVIFCLLHKHTNDDVFDDFPKTSDHFPKISEDFPKLFRR